MAMKELIFVIEESPEGGYEARALGESIFTEADNIREAVLTHFDEGKHPRIIRLHFTKEELITL